MTRRMPRALLGLVVLGVVRTAGAQATYDWSVLERLAAVHDRAVPILTRSADAHARFAGYRSALAAAPSKTTTTKATTKATTQRTTPTYTGAGRVSRRDPPPAAR